MSNMAELARSPRRIEHVRENSDKLFRDLFANCGSSSQKPICDDAGYSRIPWKDRKLPQSFFVPPQNPLESQSPVANQYSGISHAYSRSTPAINFAPVRSIYPRSQPSANLFGPSTLPIANGSLPQQSEFVNSEGVKEIHPSLPTASDPYNMAIPYTSYEPRGQYFPPQPPVSYTHISHSRQTSLPYPHPSRSGNHRFTPALKQQQSKPASDWWPQQPQAPQYSSANMVPSAAAVVGPACQLWPSPQGQWQAQEITPPLDTNAYTSNPPLPVSQSYPEWSAVNNVAPDSSWVSTTSSSTDVISSENNSQNATDDQRKELLFIAERLREERDRMKAKINELEKKLEDVMAALSVSTVQHANGFYSGANPSNPDDLVASLQLDGQPESISAPSQLENGNGTAPWGNFQ